MTASVMRDFGYQIEFRDQTIFISGDYNGKQEYTVEADWSSLSYFLNQMLVQDSNSEISFKYLRMDSYQGDRKMISFYEELGLKFEFHLDQLLVRSNSNLNNPIHSKNPQSVFENTVAEVPFPEILNEHSNHPTTQTDKFDFDWDLGDIPDTVPSLVAALVILKKSAYLRNIHNLIYKESNRIAVLNENLTRFGFQLIQDSQWPNNYFLNYMPTQLDSFQSDLNLPHLPFRAHSDHRMAMTFASITNFTAGFTNNSTSKLGEFSQEVKIDSTSKLEEFSQEVKIDSTSKLEEFSQEVKIDSTHKLEEINQKVKYDSTSKLGEFSQWVDDVDCVEKSFPQFWKEFQKLGS
jgi:3-phosphoshikimate 1-carboxyvinyltransferase